MKTHECAWIPFVLFVSVTMFVMVELTIAALLKSVSKMDQLEMAGRRRGARDADRDDNRPLGSGWIVFNLLVVAVSWFLTKVQVARDFGCFRLFSRVQFMTSTIGALTMVALKLLVVTGLLLIFFYIFGVRSSPKSLIGLNSGKKSVREDAATAPLLWDDDAARVMRIEMKINRQGWLVFDLLVVAISWFLTKVQVARDFECFRLFSRV